LDIYFLLFGLGCEGQSGLEVAGLASERANDVHFGRGDRSALIVEFYTGKGIIMLTDFVVFEGWKVVRPSDEGVSQNGRVVHRTPA
jgi:hypothetical protein